MNLIIYTLLGITLPFISGVMLMKQKKKTIWSLVSMNVGAFFVIAAIGIATQAN
jgi:hypothetical protein